MVGHLHLQAMDDSLEGKNREGLLDSPDSGLPPSPSPPFYSLSPGLLESRSGSCTTPVENHGYYKKESKEGKLLPYLLLNSTGTDLKARMYPVFFGESIEVNPKPETEIKCNSEVKYDSDKHYRDQVYCAPVPTVTSYSETVVAMQNCTWRSYKSQVYLEPRQRPLHYQSTTIVYPKHAKNTYRTTVNYNATGSRRWFVSTVQLESSEDSSPCIIYTEDL
ncbi:refilin-A-like [Oncorhynchus kisutch]|uniref:Refilin A n=1 Tax=Oncorhynchus kisutch TaxID=8019 RepID=A0A8C7C734_ONCKI|nr:refilin-A-like [Oncorhynchus kisutch]XP_020326559.1 refilin-A-like [Oncorhynchus kisutch]XP_020326564.1 refilin-A-like [Oncorhynchus kisutch]XP_020326567.1 refilin-A-like [Oncorhynchus kisutch]